MRKFKLFICALMVACMISGCGHHLYKTEELSTLHDVIDYVEEKEQMHLDVVSDSLPGKISTMLATDMDFVDYLSVKQYDPNKPTIALTFDDGPKIATTTAILDILEENHAKATFFVVGTALSEKTEPLLRRMVKMGCQIGNHSVNHTQLTTLNAQGIHDEIDTNNERIEKYSGVPCRLIRPPYGSINETVQSTVSQPLILWNIDTLDWQSRDAEKIVPIIMNNVEDGDIILMHDLYDSTVEATRQIVPALVKKGFQFVTVSELSYMKGVKMEAGGKYIDFNFND